MKYIILLAISLCALTSFGQAIQKNDFTTNLPAVMSTNMFPHATNGTAAGLSTTGTLTNAASTNTGPIGVAGTGTFTGTNNMNIVRVATNQSGTGSNAVAWSDLLTVSNTIPATNALVRTNDTRGQTNSGDSSFANLRATTNNSGTGSNVTTWSDLLTVSNAIPATNAFVRTNDTRGFSNSGPLLLSGNTTISNATLVFTNSSGAFSALFGWVGNNFYLGQTPGGGVPMYFSIFAAGNSAYVDAASDFNVSFNFKPGLTNSIRMVAGALIQTNFVSGLLYTNSSSTIIHVSAHSVHTLTTVAGNSAMELRSSGYLTNTNNFVTLVGQLAATNSLQLDMWIPAGNTWVFTNTSSGAGDSATVVGGQILIY